MTHGAIIVFSLSIRICGAAITESCHMEHIADFTTEAICRTAGHVMILSPGVSGYKCKLETREYQYRTGVGNPF